jgi:hypothetical protein
VLFVADLLLNYLQHAIDLFSVRAFDISPLRPNPDVQFRLSVRLQRNISRSETLDAARKGRILDQIREVSQTVMDEIRQAGKQVMLMYLRCPGV